MTRCLTTASRLGAWALAAAAALANTAHAQTFPTKPVRIIVPYTAGGSSDILGRLVGAALRDVWPQATIVENKTGAGGLIGADFVAKASPDGYTLLVTDLGTITAQPSLMKMPFDLHKDLAPVTAISFSPYMVVVTPKLPPKSLAELVTYSKANPGKLNFATPGIGSNPHLAGLHYATLLGLSWTFIPTKGGAAALQDVAGGHADLIFNSTLATAPHVKSGAVRLLGFASPQRMEGYPDTPTVAESIPGFTAGSWQGIFTTGGTPRDVVERLNADLVKVLQSSTVRERIANMGAQVIANKPEEMDKFLREDRARWAKVIQDNKLKVE